LNYANQPPQMEKLLPDAGFTKQKHSKQ